MRPNLQVAQAPYWTANVSTAIKPFCEFPLLALNMTLVVPDCSVILASLHEFATAPVMLTRNCPLKIFQSDV